MGDLSVLAGQRTGPVRAVVGPGSATPRFVAAWRFLTRRQTVRPAPSGRIGTLPRPVARPSRIYENE